MKKQNKCVLGKCFLRIPSIELNASAIIHLYDSFFFFYIYISIFRFRSPLIALRSLGLSLGGKMGNLDVSRTPVLTELVHFT